jgi:hypothetical protein
MKYLQMVVTVPLDEGEDHKVKMDEMLGQLPGDVGNFNDVAWTLDGTHLDDEGDDLW